FKQTGNLSAAVAVLEAGSGRSTQKIARATVHPEKFYLGLKANTQKAHGGKTFTVSGQVVDWNGAPVADAVKEVNVELIHMESEYGYGYDEGDGEEEARYDRYVHPVPEGRTKAAVAGGKFSFDVTPGQADVGYLLPVTAQNAMTQLVLAGGYPYHYPCRASPGRPAHTPRPDTPT